MPSRNPTVVTSALAFAVALAVLAIERLWIARLVYFAHENAFWLLPAAAVAAGVLIAKASQQCAAAVVGGVLAAGALVFGVYNVATNGYATDRQYMRDVEITDDALGTYDERAAFVVAERQAAGNLDIVGDIVSTRYLPGEDQFTSLVTRPGTMTALNGYAGVLTQDVELTGQADGTTCEFDTAATDRLGGWLWNSLEREIVQAHFGAVIDDGDAYGACLEDEDGDVRPVVVAPFKELRGLFPAVEVPGGVAVYDGESGQLEILYDLEPGDLPGSVFPKSVAENMRAATAATGSWWEYMRGRTGYETTEGDVDDPNGANRSEFLLSRARGSGYDYVTPLTLRGRSNFSIGAVSDVAADHVSAGELNTLTVHDLPEARKANSAVADRLKTDYSDLPDWASGMNIFEITPVSAQEWVASLGQEQNVAYRVRINADESSCLETADGEPIRCGRATATDGNGPGVSLDDEDGGGDEAREPVDLPADPSELDGMSDADLVELHRQVTEEVTERLNAREAG